MKLGVFLFVSVALHAAALVYPVLFFDRQATTPIAVTMFEAEGEGSNGSAGGGPAPQKKAVRSRLKGRRENKEQRTVASVEPHFEPQAVALTTVSTSIVSEEAPVPVVIAAREAGEASSGKLSSLSSDAGAHAGRASGGGGRGENGSGSGDSSTGFGHGSGNGVARSPVSYAYCPNPDYPDSARRQGWEGVVTLRVLIDEEGRSKSLEVNRSSGFAVLDQAAIDNVKRRCRFYPARQGEKKVESWIRIPVIFRRADFRDR